MGPSAVRRMRVFLASLLALVLALSVLVVSPAGAANTASEALVDHDENAATPRERQFAGANRYTTSLALAQAYVEEANSRGFVDSLILASGESLIDAAAAAGLSAARTAPVVLTTSNRLSRAVENFIVDEFIAEVVIIGGTDSISQAVEDDLNDIDSVSSVTRVAGDDRYATSAQVAGEITTVGEYCDTAQVSAMVVNVDSSFADVMAAGPLAYALELPILLTAADSLPADVASYLTSAEIERAVIIGGEAAVSQAVVDEITAAGVSDITRIAGENRFATAVAVRTAMADCDGVDLDNARAALINADAAADGVSAAPLLALGLGGDEATTPALLVTAEGLPAETEAFLSGLPIRAASGDHIDIQLTAIGGESAVPATVMQAAIDAAITSEPLTATITANPGTRTARVTFSSPVNSEGDRDADGFATSALNPTHYSINGNSLLAQDGLAIAGNTVTITTNGDEANGYEFRSGDVVRLAAGKVKGIRTDNRRAGAASFTVATATPDNLRPRVTIFAPEDGYELRIQVDDDNPGARNTDVLERVMLGRTALSSITGSNRPALLTETSASSYTICLFGVDGSDSTMCEDTAGGGRTLLSAGDLVTVAAEAFSDARGNTSRTTIARVVANNAAPVAIRAAVTEPVPYDNNGAEPGGVQNAAWVWRDDKGTTDDPSDDDIYLSITAKSDGVAGGAAGNGWNVDWFGAADTDDTQEASVSVLANRRIIRITFDDEATLFTVVTALLENETVTENFDVASDVLANPSVLTGALGTDETTGLLRRGVLTANERNKPTAMRQALTGGESAVTLRLVYNDILQDFDYAALRTSNQTSDDFPDNNMGWAADADVRQSLVTGISVVLHSDTGELPEAGDTITLPAGLADSYKSGAASAAVTVRLRAG